MIFRWSRKSNQTRNYHLIWSSEEEFSVKSHHHAIWRNIYFDNFIDQRRIFCQITSSCDLTDFLTWQFWSTKKRLFCQMTSSCDLTEFLFWQFDRSKVNFMWSQIDGFGLNKEVNEKLVNPIFKHFSNRIKSFGWWVITFRRVITHLRNHDSAIWTLRATSYHQMMFFTTQ